MKHTRCYCFTPNLLPPQLETHLLFTLWLAPTNVLLLTATAHPARAELLPPQRSNTPVVHIVACSRERAVPHQPAGVFSACYASCARSHVSHRLFLCNTLRIIAFQHPAPYSLAIISCALFPCNTLRVIALQKGYTLHYPTRLFVLRETDRVYTSSVSAHRISPSILMVSLSFQYYYQLSPGAGLRQSLQPS